MQRRRRTPLWAWTIVGTALAWLLFWPVMWLEIELTHAGSVHNMARIASSIGEPFSVRFIHSVELSPVVEFFTLDESGAVVLTGTRYHGFGAGLPTDAGEGTLALDGDAFVISGLHRTIGELRVRLSPMNDYTVIHRNRDFRWPTAPAGARLTVRGLRSGRLSVWLDRLVERRE